MAADAAVLACCFPIVGQLDKQSSILLDTYNVHEERARYMHVR